MKTQSPNYRFPNLISGTRKPTTNEDGSDCTSTITLKIRFLGCLFIDRILYCQSQNNTTYFKLVSVHTSLKTNGFNKQYESVTRICKYFKIKNLYHLSFLRESGFFT